uniref:Uncharacterized protein n=1 Tax=Arundo donax TaxID=35708 RepID=A0A0A9BNM2_ARUDO
MHCVTATCWRSNYQLNSMHNACSFSGAMSS